MQVSEKNPSRILGEEGPGGDASVTYARYSPLSSRRLRTSSEAPPRISLTSTKVASRCSASQAVSASSSPKPPSPSRASIRSIASKASWLASISRSATCRRRSSSCSGMRPAPPALVLCTYRSFLPSLFLWNLQLKEFVPTFPRGSAKGNGFPRTLISGSPLSEKNPSRILGELPELQGDLQRAVNRRRKPLAQRRVVQHPAKSSGTTRRCGGTVHTTAQNTHISHYVGEGTVSVPPYRATGERTKNRSSLA